MGGGGGSAHAADLVDDPEGLEAVMAALGQAPTAWSGGGEGVGGPPGWAGAVTLTTIDRVHERRWPFVVMAGCVDGRFPATTVRIPFFDPHLAFGPEVASLSDRAAALLADERRRFRRAAGAALETVVAVSAPAAGELISRFVEDWPPAAGPALTAPPSMARPAALIPTANATPVHPGGVLRLSATQLDCYANCPWNYGVQYGLGVRGGDSVSSRFGTLVHKILETFLGSHYTPPLRQPTDASTHTPIDFAADRPDSGRSFGSRLHEGLPPVDPPPDRSRARLFALADEYWDDSIFDYRPQSFDFRRRLDTLLEAWYSAEGESARPLRTEYRFEFESGGHTVVGSIDRLDLIDSTTDPPSLEVIDYKTGALKSKRVTDANLQLPLYHLAVRRDPVLRALGEPTRLRLAFLSEPRDVFLPCPDDLETLTEARIADGAAAIVAERFDASVTADCEYCDLRRICPLQPEGREVGP